MLNARKHRGDGLAKETISLWGIVFKINIYKTKEESNWILQLRPYIQADTTFKQFCYLAS